MSTETSTQPIVDAEPPVEAPVEAEVPKDAEENKVEPAVPSEVSAESVEEKSAAVEKKTQDDAANETVVNPTQEIATESTPASAEDNSYYPLIDTYRWM